MQLLKIYPVVLSCACLSLPAYAEHVVLPGLTVETTASEASPLRQTALPSPVADSAEQLKKLPGANINRNGPLTSIAQYRGMFGDRVNVLVDGIRISQAGPNSMDSPLSYIAASQLDSLTLYRGIAPVSSGIETIGGSILANSKQPAFSLGDDFQISGEATAGYAHNNDSHQLGLNTGISNQNHRLSLHASRDKGDDQRFDGGNILPSQHERDSFGGGYAYQNNDGLLASFDIEHHDTGATGTPALPMDILFARGERYKTLISQTLNNGDKFSLRLNYQNADHLMNNFSLRQGPAVAAMQRQTYTDVIAYGAQLHYQHQNWLFGLETDAAEHNATIFNPNNSDFRLTNFNQVERDRYSVFAEWQGDLNADWSLQAGGRYSKINSNADDVSAMGLMGPMANMMQMRANAFNAEDRRQQDDLFDAALTLNRMLRADLDLIVGAARKQRAASYQERYLWFPAESTSGLADGNTYLGDIQLDPETAYQYELGLDWHRPTYGLSPRLFYHHVDDYIQGVATAQADTLQFTNVDARLYGLDTSWYLALNNQWQLDGTISYVRGERRDTDDNLYRIAPLTNRVQLSYIQSDWQLGLSMVNVAAQNKVSDENSEQKTSGYSLFHLSGQYQLDQNLTVHAGIDNLFDRRYQDHLGGYNRVQNPDIPVDERLYGVGRSAYLAVNYLW